MQQTAVALADFLGDVTIPPIGGETIVSVFGIRRIDGNVIRAFQLNDTWGMAGDSRITAALGIRDKPNT